MSTWKISCRPVALVTAGLLSLGLTGATAISAVAAPDAATTVSTTAARDTLPNGSRLNANDELVSANGQFRLSMQSDGNLVAYDLNNNAVWSTGTNGSGATQLVMQSDGNLVLYTKSEQAVWSTDTSTSVDGDKTELVINNNGTLSVKRRGKVVWHSAQSSLDTLNAGSSLNPGQNLTSGNSKYRLAHQTDGNVVIYGPGDKVVWETRTDGSKTTSLTMQTDGNLVLYGTDNKAVWDTRTDVSSGGDTAKLVLHDDGVATIFIQGRAVWDTKGSVNPKPTNTPVPEPTKTPRPSDAARAAVDFAQAQVGKPFRVNAVGPHEWGNAQIVSAAWREGRVNVPANASQIYNMRDKKVTWDKRQAGDLIVYQVANQAGNEVRVAMYMGNDEYLHSSPENTRLVVREKILKELMGTQLVRPNLGANG